MLWCVFLFILLSVFAQDQPLTPGVVIGDQKVSKFGFDFYYINLTAGNSVGTFFQVSQTSGNTYLFVQINAKPTISSYAFAITTGDAIKQLLHALDPQVLIG